MQNAKCRMQNEQRLIAYDAVYQYAFKGVHGGGLEDEDFDAIVNAIDAVPTVDAVEVVHGRWVEIIKDERFGEEWDEIALYECSACKSEFVEGMGSWPYCPNCGAKMDGDGNGN